MNNVVELSCLPYTSGHTYLVAILQHRIASENPFCCWGVLVLSDRDVWASHLFSMRTFCLDGVQTGGCGGDVWKSSWTEVRDAQLPCAEQTVQQAQYWNWEPAKEGGIAAVGRGHRDGGRTGGFLAHCSSSNQWEREFRSPFFWDFHLPQALPDRDAVERMKMTAEGLWHWGLCGCLGFHLR